MNLPGLYCAEGHQRDRKAPAHQGLTEQEKLDLVAGKFFLQHELGALKSCKECRQATGTVAADIIPNEFNSSNAKLCIFAGAWCMVEQKCVLDVAGSCLHQNEHIGKNT